MLTSQTALFADIVRCVGGNQEAFEREWDSRVLSSSGESKNSSPVFEVDPPSATATPATMTKRKAVRKSTTGPTAGAAIKQTKRVEKKKKKEEEEEDDAENSDNGDDKKTERAKPRQFSRRWRETKRRQLTMSPILKRSVVKSAVLNMLRFHEHHGELGKDVLADKKEQKKVADIRISKAAVDLVREQIEIHLGQLLRNARYIQQASKPRDRSLPAPGAKPTSAQKHDQKLEGSISDVQRRKSKLTDEEREAYEKMCRARDDLLLCRSQDTLLARHLAIGEKVYTHQGCLGRA